MRRSIRARPICPTSASSTRTATGSTAPRRTRSSSRPKGGDANPGTKAKPKRDVQAAVDAVEAGKAKYVLVAFGTYGHVRVGASGVGIYGGYDPASWTRRGPLPGRASAHPRQLPRACFVSGAKGVVLQHLEVRSLNGTLNVAGTGYGIRAKNGASVTLQRVVVRGGDGAAGASGADGRAGASGVRGEPRSAREL